MVIIVPIVINADIVVQYKQDLQRPMYNTLKFSTCHAALLIFFF